MSVHYKFKSALEYDTVTFDGLHISVKDLKNAIIQQKRIGKNTDFDLQVTNAQTKENYEDENALIPKNTSLLIARIPTACQTKNKQWEGYGGDSTPPLKLDEGGPIAKAVDLSSLDAPEDDKIKAMMSQSTQDYDPSNYMKIRGANQMGAVPPNYRCYKCHQTGHWIKDCPLSKGPEPMEIKKSTGIPLSFMVPVEGPQVPGAMMTPNGSYAVPVLDHQTYNTQKQANPSVLIEEKLEIPDDLLCSICSDLLTDAVMIPCCGNSFCDECIRNILLESEEHECPDCHEKDISPGTLIPNRFLRNSVGNFKNTTGYVKKSNYKQPIKKMEIEEKTIISEADSTEHSKTEEIEKLNDTKIDEKIKMKKICEDDVNNDGPPGVSPEESPKQQITKRVNSSSREKSSSSRHKRRSRDDSPPSRRQHRHRSPPYNDGRQDERPDTPTVDEPSFSSNTSSGPLPNFHLPPPGTAPPPYLPTAPYGVPPRPMFDASRPPPPSTASSYMPPGPYNVPTRPIFDASRPPIGGGGGGPMYNMNPNFTARHHHHGGRDYGLNERRIRSGTPSGVIDDPLAAFNRMLREKDERERRKRNRRFQQHHHHNNSYSRSRSRSYSRSPPPSLRRIRGSRSPRRRHSRSRSRSFSMSRSRSRSFSGSMRGSPFREFSPRHSPPRHRRGHSRYRSPIRSPPRHRYQDRYRERDYNREHDRDYNRNDERAFSNREHRHHRNIDKEQRTDLNYFDNYDERRNKNQWQQQQQQQQSTRPDGFYPNEMQHFTANRYPPRDYPFMNKPELPPNLIQSRRYEDVAPPGVEEPPVPGLEPELEIPSSPIRHESPLIKSPKRKSKSKDKETSPDKHHKRKRHDSSDKDKKSDDEKWKKTKDRKKKKDKKDLDKKKRNRKEKHRKHSKDEENEERTIEEVKEEKKDELKNLYDEEVGIDGKIFENYGKLNEDMMETKEIVTNPEEETVPEMEQQFNKDEDILEIHTDLDLKTDIQEQSKLEMLAQLPEKSKWEVDDDNLLVTSPKSNEDNKTGNKVTNEVLKRAENAIFAKAINAIRPIEIKKISLDRAKLYSNNEQDEEKMIEEPPKKIEEKKEQQQQQQARISVKDRLGIKVVEDEKDRNKSKSISPFSKRGNETNRNYAIGERRVEMAEKKRQDRRRDRTSPRRDYRSRTDYRNRDDQRHRRQHEPSRSNRREDTKHSRSRHEVNSEKKRKRTRSRSESVDDKNKRKKKEKKPKKEKSKKVESEKKIDKPSAETTTTTISEEVKKKTTLDESNFEPDYDLESESEKEIKNVVKKLNEEKKSSSSSESSGSSSDDEKNKKKKHKKHRKKKIKSSSSSETESETSDDEKKRKKHKKKQKKKKKSKHK